MNLGVQYYRPPFPDARYWRDDLARIRDSGLNTVQLWVLWGWVESQPGQFRFDDYDRLFDLADGHGLGVVLSTIAEIQPYWIHREAPGSEMIDHLGRKVVSSNRSECHFGLTPGGCTDVPEVWARMADFLDHAATRYCTAKNLRGWDAWNELRWNVQSDGLVCFCPDTLRAFRRWLEHRYGDLDALNRAWSRRYGSFEEILPGKLPGRTYTEMMAFEHFLTCRANRHAKARYDRIKGIDPRHPVTVHGGDPSVMWGGWAEDHALNRGNDWFFADDLDGVGCSSFPKWFGIDDADFGIRVECVKSAARNKQVWLSEVQGGRAAQGFDVYSPVDASSQRKWIWNGIAGGAKTILFWCWRDEVFGRESGGYGIIGRDGLADERLAALKATGSLIEAHRDRIAGYEPVAPQVGVLFSPQSYYLYWAQEGSADRAVQGLLGYARGLVRRSIPFTIVEEEHLEVLADLRILFMPRVIVTGDATEKALEEFAARGGTLVCESECGAFTPAGIYRDPGDRWTARLTGRVEIGRRPLPGETIAATLDGRTFTLPAGQWTTPFANDGEPGLFASAPWGSGKIMLIGSYLGDAYRKKWHGDFEEFLDHLARGAGWKPDLELRSPPPGRDSFVYLKYGESAGKKMIFVFFPNDCDRARLQMAPGFIRGDRMRDIITGCTVQPVRAERAFEMVVTAPPERLAVLVEE